MPSPLEGEGWVGVFDACVDARLTPRSPSPSPSPPGRGTRQLQSSHTKKGWPDGATPSRCGAGIGYAAL